jgi:hypothetical protein
VTPPPSPDHTERSTLAAYIAHVAGATTVLAADVPHAYEGDGRGPCELIMTVRLPMEHRGG